MTEENSVPVPLDPLPEDYEDKRLWLGNLDSRITEYTLVKLLQKFGSIEKFDLLFHRSGPLEGQPRGYAFVTYASTDVAVKAKSELHGRLIGSKNICVKWAHNMSKGEMEKQKLVPDIPALAGAKSEKRLSRLTTIQAIEAKLKTMENATSSKEFKISDKPSIITGTSVYSQSKQINSIKHKSHDRLKHKPYTRSKWK